MRFLGKLIKWILILVVVLIIGIAIFAYFFDLNKYKDKIAEIVEKQTGRTLAIKGNAQLGISLIPTLELENVEFGNAAWSKNPQMVKLERLDVKVSILPLLKKQIEVYKVVLIKPEIYLEVNEAGEANWDFKPLKTSLSGVRVYAQNDMVQTAIIFVT